MVQEEPCVFKNCPPPPPRWAVFRGTHVSWVRSRVSQDKHEFAAFIIYEL